jgi:50S ribosomal subunit-associated GTPase HflX
LYIVDASDESRFEESKKVFDEIIKNQNIGKIPIFVWLNKCDDPKQFAEAQLKILDLFELEKLERDYMIQCVSAHTGVGVRESVEILIQNLEKNARYVDTDGYI